MIMKFMKRIPAGMMIVPLILGSFIYTFFPHILQIGSLTTATFSKAAAATAMGIQLFCLGTTLQVRDMPAVLKRGGVLLLGKYAIGAAVGILIGKAFGMAGVLGLTTLSIVSAVTNSNGSVYLSLMQTYGDEKDSAAMALLSLNDGPFLTLITLGASGMAQIPFISLIAAVAPIFIGMILGNIDKSMKEFFAPATAILIPFVGFSLGAGIDLSNVLRGGFPGILLGLITIVIGGSFTVLCDRLISKRPGYAAWATASTAGNAVAVPAAVALIDPTWTQYVDVATTQVAASTVLTAILVPIITSWWVKKYGSPKMPLES